MSRYSFQETLRFFGEKLKTEPPEEEVEGGVIELIVDRLQVHITKESMTIPLGLILQPIRESRLKELATSNYLGINTGGCTLTLDEPGVMLKLKVNINPTSSPQENWEWLHRLMHAATEWNKKLSGWEEFILLNGNREMKR